MQDAEAQRHLLECATRDAAHKSGIGQAMTEARYDESVRGPGRVDAAVGQIDATGLHAARTERLFQAARMPARFVGHDRDAQPAGRGYRSGIATGIGIGIGKEWGDRHDASAEPLHCRCSSSASTPPPCHVAPL